MGSRAEAAPPPRPGWLAKSPYESPAYAEFMQIADRNRRAYAAGKPRMDALLARHEELCDAHTADRSRVPGSP